ncbi:transglycosylase SLT domain-containing protein [Rhodococcus sp. BP-241]|uniref:transglycosylase SLT domain-containing protein n=1 Tax=Rhodococcus sp. BP-241 TaxID=2739441 RepID=UPI001EB57CBE|nr:transglycosylase SLT domain-containing protein [Rhodococcus sp. BP-241]MBY6708475.1 transglycosylase SLT domain-containing protein [Rhodococcus sp. BP-241]
MSSAKLPIVPDLTGFHRKVKTLIRAERVDAPVMITPDFEKFRPKLEQGLGRYRASIGVQVKPDFSGFNSELRSFTGAHSGHAVTVPVDLDLTRARAQMGAFRAEMGRGLTASLDLDITAALARIAALRAAADGIGGSAGAGGAGSGLRSVAGGAKSIVPAAGLAKAALLGLASVNLIPLVGQLAKAAGVIALLPAAGAAAASSLATVVIGSTGVFDAFSAGSKAAEAASTDAAAASKVQASAAKQVESAARGVTDAQAGVTRAERGVADAQKQSQRAQEDLTQARKDAQEQIEDLNLALKGSSLDERDAELSLRRAQQRLAELGKDGQPVTMLDFDEAVLGVDQAKQRIEEVRERNADLKAETDAANKAGVDGSQQVVQAQEAVADADLRVVDARQSVVDAQTAVLDAQTALTDAQNAAASATTGAATAADKYSEALANLAPNARDFVEQTRNLGGAWKDLRLEIQDNLFDGLGTSITELADRYFPTLRTGLGGIATEINGGLRRSLADLSSESSALDWTKIFENTRQAIGPLLDGLNDLWGSLTNIAAIGSEFLPGFGDSFSNVMQEFREFTESESGQNKIRDFIRESIDALKDFIHIGGQVIELVRNIFRGSDETGKGMLDGISATLDRWNEFLGSEEGQQKMRTFFEDVRNTTNQILDLIRQASALAGQLAPLIPVVSTGIPKVDVTQPYAGNAGGPNAIGGAIARQIIPQSWTDEITAFGEQMRSQMGALAVEGAGLALSFVGDLTVKASGAWQSLQDKVSAVTTGVGGLIDVGKAKVGELRDDAAQKLSDMGLSWDSLGSGIGSVISTMVDTAFPGLTTALSGVQTFFGNIVDGIGRKWSELKDLAATPINWIIDNVINGTLKNAWNAVAAVIPGLSPWDGVARIETPEAGKGAGVTPKFATGGIIPGYTPGRDPYTIGVSGGEAVMRPEWQRAMGPNYINTANKVARTQGVAGVRKMQRDANFAFGGVVDESLWNAVSGAFPNATLNSALRPGHSGYHGKGQAIDVGGPMQQVADWAVGTLGNKLAQVIWGPGPLLYNVGGNSITDQDQLRNQVYADDLPGHYDHVHIAADRSLEGVEGGVVSDAGGSVGGGGILGAVRNRVADQVAGLFEKPLNALGSQIPDFGPSKFGQLPRAAYDELKNKAVEYVRSKVAGTTDGSGTAPGGPLIGTADQYRPLVERLFDEKGIDRKYVDKYLYQLQRESTFNPNAINLTDSNAVAGTPSKGIAQVIDPTFQSYKDPGHEDIWNAEDNIRASLNYLLRDPKFGGRGVAALTGAGYDNGGIFKDNTIGWNTSGKPEAVLTNTQWQLFDGFNKNLGKFANGGVVDPNEYARQRFMKYGEQVGGIVKSAIPEILGISGTPLDLTNNRYLQAAMDTQAAFAAAAPSASANYGSASPPASSTVVDQARGVVEQHTHFHVSSIDEAFRKHQLEQQKAAMAFGGR